VFSSGGVDGYRNDAAGADHVTIIGPTRSGKSTIAMAIAELRPFVATFVEKPRDDELKARLRHDRYRLVRELPDTVSGNRSARVFMWPSHVDGAPLAAQARQFGHALDVGYRRGGWHFVIHEGQHFIDQLRARSQIVTMLRMGASNNVGMIICTGRPAWMPHDIYSAATHLFIFNTNDEDDLRSIAGLNGYNNRRLRLEVERLDFAKRDVVYVNLRTRYACVTRYPKGLT
jgi:energy-coupling factor transporter ATP-binding protein EcfA2